MRFGFGDVVEGFFKSKTCQFVLGTQPGTHYQSEKMVSDYQSVPYPAKSQPEVWSEILHIRDAQLLTPI